MAKLTSETKVTNNRGLITTIVILAAIILAGSGWAWWHFVRSNPERVFNAMLDNNLRTTAVTRKVKQTSGDQNLDQTVQLFVAPEHISHGMTALNQTGDEKAQVVTETIGTPFIDYIRYLDVISDQKTEKGEKVDFSRITNQWGKTAVADGSESQTTGELYNESVLGVVPFANLPKADRQVLLEFVKASEVYKTDYSKVERSINNGRPEYTYTVAVQPAPYVAMLKELARRTGLTQLEGVDPSHYKNSAPLSFKLVVDVWSQQLSGIIYNNGARTERLSAYGVKGGVKVPAVENTIPLSELQNRVQSIQ